MADQPTIDKTGEPPHDTDTTGQKWMQALVASDGKILAGRDELGNFHCYVDNEALFDNALAIIQHHLSNTD